MKIAQDSTMRPAAQASASHALMPDAAGAPIPTISRIDTTRPSCSIDSAKATRLAVTMTRGRSCANTNRISAGAESFSRMPCTRITAPSAMRIQHNSRGM